MMGATSSWVDFRHGVLHILLFGLTNTTAAAAAAEGKRSPTQ